MIDQKAYIEIERMLERQSYIVIAIDGQAGSGKTTLANEFAKRYNGHVFHMDDYFLRNEQRTPKRLSENDGFIDYERFEKEIINHLDDDVIVSRAFDCQKQTYKDIQQIKKPRVLIIEGAYALRKSWQRYYDLKILITIDGELQKKRIRKRNTDKIYQQFINEWIPRENAYIKANDLDQYADYVCHIEDKITETTPFNH